MQNQYNNYLKRQKQQPINNFKEKITNSLSGKTINNTTTPNTSNAVANFAFDKSKIRTGYAVGGSANRDNWKVVFDPPFPDNNYRVIITPVSTAGKCPSGWYAINLAPTGFIIYCNGTAPTSGFAYLAINF